MKIRVTFTVEDDERLVIASYHGQEGLAERELVESHIRAVYASAMRPAMEEYKRKSEELLKAVRAQLGIAGGDPEREGD